MPIIAIMAGIVAISIGVAVLAAVLEFLFYYVLPVAVLGCIVFGILYFMHHANKAEYAKQTYPEPTPPPSDYATQRIAILKLIEQRTGLTAEEEQELAKLEGR